MSKAAALFCEHNKVVSACLISDRMTEVEAIKWVVSDARPTDRVEVVTSERVRLTLGQCEACVGSAA